MAFQSGGSEPGQGLSEINVTPLVDVMLVLLVIFMVASSVDSQRVERELEMLQRDSRQDEIPPPEVHPSQKVPVNLPRVDSEQVNLSEEQKLVLSVDAQLTFHLGDTKFLECPDARGEGAAEAGTTPAFKACMQRLEGVLGANEKLKTDQELYLRADRGIDYGQVLGVMAHIRKAGVTKFGLVADPEVEP